ncbi:unnamed protein product [Alopecurus aequalis]
MEPSCLRGASPLPTLGDFVHAAAQLGGSLKSTRRAAFAPGGRGSRFASSPSSDDRGRRGGGSSWRRRVSPQCSGWPRECASPPHPSLVRGVERPSPAGRVALAAASPPSSPGNPREQDLARWGANPSIPEGGLSLEEAQADCVGLPLAQPTQAGVAPPVALGIWLWIRRNSRDLSLGFPAREEEVRRRGRRARKIRIHHPPPPLSRSFAQVAAMDPRSSGTQGHPGGRREDRGHGGGDKREAELRATALAAQGSRALVAAGKQTQAAQGCGAQAAPTNRAQGQHGKHAQTTQGGRAPPGGPWWASRAKKRSSQGGAGAPPRAREQGGGQTAEKITGKRPATEGLMSLVNRPEGDGPTAASTVECFKCGRPSHFQAACMNLLLCVLCGIEDHHSVDCVSKGKKPILRTLGSAVGGEGFFDLEFEEDSEEEEETNGAIITMKNAPLSKDQLDRELHHLVKVEWDWQVTISKPGEFFVVFPTREILRMCTRTGRLFLPLRGVDAEIRLADTDPKPAVTLKEAWVRLTGVPRRFRRGDRLKAGLGCWDASSRSTRPRSGSAGRSVSRLRAACRAS